MIFTIAPSIYSQTKTVSGKVIDKERKTPITGVQVKIRPVGEKRIIAYSQTSAEGVFEINIAGSLTNCELEFSRMGYASQTKEMPVNGQTVTIELTIDEIQLKEVIVKPQEIGQQGDTIRYLVSAFAVSQDRTIGDVLKKMPGIEVLQSGEIKYQGQSINKFYVEGSDLLEGRYGLATNNVSYKDVASVEVMENHQPVNAIRDLVFSTKPAINIKLKKDAKSRWAGTGKGGSGFMPLLWNVEAFAMRFKSKVQLMNTYKGNNTGYNPADDMISFSSVGDFVSNSSNSLPDHIRINPSTIPGLDKSRSQFNTTNALSSNSLFKLKKDYDLVSEVIYSDNLFDWENSSGTTYFLDNGQIIIEGENEKAGEHKQSIGGKLKLKANRDKFYINNTLLFDFDRSNMNMDISGSYPNAQKALIRNQKISNDFSWLQRIEKKTITIRSKNEYISKPQNLIVTGNDRTPVRQDIDLSSFFTDNSINYSFGLRAFRINSKAGLSYSGRQMRNKSDDLQHHSSFEKFKADITPSIEYGTSPFELRLILPFYYLHYNYKAGDKDQPQNSFNIDPSLSFRWYSSLFFEWHASASYGKDLPDENLFYTGAILNNYRNISLGYPDFEGGSKVNFRLGMKYKDIMRTLFINAGITIMHTQRKRMPEQNFTGDYIVNSYFPAVNDMNILLADMTFSKGVEAINGTLAVYPSYIHSAMAMNRNGTKIPYLSDEYSLRSKVNSKLTRWCNLVYEANFSRNNLRMKNEGQLSSFDNFSESITLAFAPLESLQLTVTTEHYCNQLSTGQYKKFIFLDCSASYLLGDRWEIACIAKNLLDERNYSFFMENELAAVSKYYKIRQRNVILNVMYRF
jgi:hypothetical protein